MARAPERARDPGIPPPGFHARGGELRLPCSAGQRRSWLLDQLEPDNPARNIVGRWRLDGKIVHADLEEALRLVAMQQPLLRTAFTAFDGEPWQRVEPQIRLHIPLIDLTRLGEPDAGIEAERIARINARARFDPATAPLLRLTHLRLSERRSWLLIAAHELICDEDSLEILMRQLAQIYTALRKGQVPDPADLPLTFGELLAQEEADGESGHEEFWSRVLHEMTPFELPTAGVRPARLSANADMLSIALERDLMSRLAVIAHKHGCTPPMASLAVLLTLLHRYTGQTDIAIGMAAGRRDGDALRNLIAPLGNVLILRVGLSEDPHFLELLGRVWHAVSAALEHPLPFSRLVEIARPGRDPSRNTLYSVSFNFRAAPLETASSDVLRVTELPPCSPGTVCDLEFTLLERAEGWTLLCEYNSDLFDAGTIQGLLAHFQNLLRGIVIEPKRSLSALPILDAEEIRWLTQEVNRTATPYPGHLTVPELVERQARRTPAAIALVAGGESLTYAGLEAASNRLARKLRRRRLAPDTRIGLLLDRSVDLPIALLAVLKAGAAYVPLDPAYPPKRIEHILEDSRPAAVITRSGLRERLPAGMQAVLLDAEPESLAPTDADPLRPFVGPTDLAYVIYTSGSTGRPKGVEISHRGVVNLLSSMAVRPGIDAHDVLLAVTTPSFDIAVLELLLPLTVGARVVIAREAELADGRRLAQLIRETGTTVMQATPATWRLLLEAGFHPPRDLKMLVGGEALPRELAERLLEGGGELWNMYGPTETTVWSSCKRVSRGDETITVGTPIANTLMYVLDARDRLLPPGMPGQLHIGGDGVARGYHGKPELTAEKFIANPFAEGRLYRTGDLARCLPNGEVQILGRIDNQIKLRGFRIELGEIDAVLLQHPSVTDAVTVLGQDAAGGGAIRAYVVARPGTAESLPGDLRTHLVQELPAYMCPASITVLDALPRTPNGKIDRRALPAPDARAAQTDAPQLLNEVELRLARIWCAVLGLPAVDKNADFFELGGHSLLAARLLARIEKEFDRRLSLVSLFSAPNIAEQAKLLTHGEQREFDFRQVVKLRPNGTRPPLIAIHNTGVYYYHLSKRLGPEQPLTALQLFDPSVSRERMPRTLEEIAGEYVELIRRLQPSGPYALIGWCVAGVIAFEVARQLTAAGDRVSLLAMIDTWAPGHLRRLPRWRAKLSDYSYRLHLIWADWRRVVSRQQTFREFLGQRTFFKRLLRWFGRATEEAQAVPFDAREKSAENYDRWLLGYMEEVAERYEPKPYPGRITLLCSEQEPKGLFLDPQMGWSAFADDGVDIAVIVGDHFTVFKGRGLEQMATHVTHALATPPVAGG